MSAVLCPYCGAMLIVGLDQLFGPLACPACSRTIPRGAPPLTEKEIRDFLRAKHIRESNDTGDSPRATG